jgi:DNA-binding PadR family transcriptional regulator
MWRPSPGSVYPALAQLEDEGLIRSQELDGRKSYAITDEGREDVAKRDSEAPAPWEQPKGHDAGQAQELGAVMKEVGIAFFGVLRTGSEVQMKRAQEILAQARRDLYRILADGEPPQA